MFIIQLLQQAGEGGFEPCSPRKGDQAMSLSYKAFGFLQIIVLELVVWLLSPWLGKVWVYKDVNMWIYSSCV